MVYDAHPAAVHSSPAPSEPAAAPASTPSPAPAPSTPSAPAPMPAAAEAQPAAPTWQPNFKMKVMDQDHEIPEWARPLVKDADSEKQVREIWEKAIGLDHVKPKFAETKKQLDAVMPELQGFRTGVQELRDLYNKDDFDTFFQKLKIPEEKVLQWFVKKAQYLELPQEQRQILDARKAAEQRAEDLEKQNLSYQEKYEGMVAQAKAQSLQVELAKPDVRAMIDAFDARAGKPGSFHQAVIDHGELTWIRTNGQVDLTPEQAVQQVLSLYGGGLQAHPQAPAMVPVANIPQAPQAPGQAPKKQATLPNIAGRQASSVARSKPKSLDDLRKISAEKYGS